MRLPWERADTEAGRWELWGHPRIHCGHVPFFSLLLLGACMHGPVIGAGTTVACVGTSLTQGDQREYQKVGVYINKGGYPALLQSRLGTSYQVSNFGLGGRVVIRDSLVLGKKSYWYNSQYQSVLALRPDACVIEFGTNETLPDVWEKFGHRFARDYADFAASIANAKPGAAIFVCRPLPIFPNLYGHRDSVMLARIIPIIDSIASVKRYPLIDLRKPFLDMSLRLPDGVHPDSTAAATMASIVHSALVSYLSALSCDSHRQKVRLTVREPIRHLSPVQPAIADAVAGMHVSLRGQLLSRPFFASASSFRAGIYRRDRQ